MAKYKDLAAVKAAFDSGELNRDTDQLILDNDQSHLYVDDVCMFRGGGPDELAGDALNLLDIPWEGA